MYAKTCDTGAQVADMACYEHFNVMGVSHGHCGVDATSGQLRACDIGNSACGILHCTAGRPVPIVTMGTYVNTQFSHNHQTFTCK